MRHYAVIAASAVTVVFSSGVVSAASITNRDARDHKVTIVAEGENPRSQVLKPEGVLSDICPKGCIIRLDDNEADEYELEGPEVVSIEDGLLYYDGPEASSEPAPEAEKRDGQKR